jgi:hypothetical protein
MVLSERLAVVLFAITFIAGLPASILISRVIVG